MLHVAGHRRISQRPLTRCISWRISSRSTFRTRHIPPLRCSHTGGLLPLRLSYFFYRWVGYFPKHKGYFHYRWVTLYTRVAFPTHWLLPLHMGYFPYTWVTSAIHSYFPYIWVTSPTHSASYNYWIIQLDFSQFYEGKHNNEFMVKNIHKIY